MGGGIIFTFHIFFARTNLKLIETQEKVWGPGGMLPREIFENLRDVMAILVLFD